MKAGSISATSAIGGGGSIAANNLWQAPDWMLQATAWMELIAIPVFMLGVLVPFGYKIYRWWKKRK